MPPILEQLSFDLPELASDHFERLLADEVARETADPAYGLLLIQSEEIDDAA